jgi:hypothetical protein
MYSTDGATIRADINIKVEEAAAADRFFIGERVMPPMSQDAVSGEYPKIDIKGGQLLKAGSTLRSSTGAYGEVVRNWTKDNYLCLDRGLEERVDDAKKKDLARFFNAEVTAGRLTMRNMKLDHEKRVKDSIMNTGNFAATNSAVAYTIALLATIDFPQDVLAAIGRVEDKGQQANTIVIPDAVFKRLVLSTKLQSWVRGTLKGSAEMPVNAPNITASFADHGITQVLIGKARIDTANQNLAASVS